MKRRGATAGWTLAALVAAFACLFCAFEVLHPVADLLHEQVHHACGDQTTPAPGTHGGEGAAGDAHGPVLLCGLPFLSPPAAFLTRTPARHPAPESPFLELRSPVPIPS